MCGKPLRIRFALRSQVKPDGCIEWIGKRYSNGYGALMHQKRWRLAHRVAWELARGPIPSGLVICHRCDNRKCVNVDHLFVGTQAENVADAKTKNRLRAAHGSRSPRAKVNESNVEEIREMAGKGMKQKTIAARFGISRKQVSVIVSGRQWAHVAQAASRGRVE